MAVGNRNAILQFGSDYLVAFLLNAARPGCECNLFKKIALILCLLEQRLIYPLISFRP